MAGFLQNEYNLKFSASISNKLIEFFIPTFQQHLMSTKKEKQQKT